MPPPVRTRVPAPPSGPGVLLATLGLPLVAALAASTQALARRAAFHPALGEPLVALPPGWTGPAWAGAAALAALAAASLAGRARWGWAPLGVLSALSAAAGLVAAGPVYPLTAGARWTWRAAIAGGPDGEAALVAFGGAFLVGLVLASWAAGSARVEAGGTHGTASWGDGGSLRVTGRRAKGRPPKGRPPAGLLLGRLRGTDLRYDGPGHLLTVAPTRAGKGVGAVVPALLETADSVVVTDPKGENYALTAAYRRRALGHRVVALDPFGLAGRLGLPDAEVRAARGAYNPLGLVEAGSPDAVDDAAMIADMLVVPDHGGGGGAEGSFWDDEARALLAGLVLFVATHERDPARRTLLTVREHLTLPRDDFERVLGEMKGSAVPAVRRAAHRHEQKADKERSGVVSSAQRHTHFLDSPRMSRVLGGPAAGSAWSLADADAFADALPVDLAALGSAPITVYLIVPPDRLDTFARWLRLVVACAVTAVARRPATKGRRVLLLLDEFAQLGAMAPVRRAVSLMAGYGLRVWVFLQDLTQLKALYPRGWETFVANADVVQAFSVTDQTTAEYLSKLAGRTTVFGRSESTGRSRGRSPSRSAGSSAAEQGRDLVTPDELRRLGPGTQLLLARGEDPLLAEKVRYYDDRKLARRAPPRPASLA